MLDQALLDEAKIFANSQTLEELLQRLKATYQQSWLNEQRPDHREHLWRMANAVEAVRNELKALTSESKVAEFNKRVVQRAGVR